MRALAVIALLSGASAGCFLEPLPRYDQERQRPPGARPSEVTALSMGAEDACVAGDGAVYCWGANREGISGADRAGNRRRTDVPRRVVDLEGAVQVSVGRAHACARTEAGEVHCWGSNDAGELGDGTYEPRVTPLAVPGFGPAVALSVGGTRSCAVRRDGALYCWGDRGSGFIHMGDTSPVPVAGLSGVSAVARGDMHACAVAGGRVLCWGQNRFGQIGNGVPGYLVDAPVDVGLSGVTEVVVGGEHSCALRSDGGVFCWGAAYASQLGEVPTATCEGAPCQPVPTEVPGLSGVVQLAAGASHTCARFGDGRVACWGTDGGLTAGAAPTIIDAAAGARLLAAEGGGTCAVDDAATLTCWGTHEARARDEMTGFVDPAPAIVEW